MSDLSTKQRIIPVSGLERQRKWLEQYGGVVAGSTQLMDGEFHLTTDQLRLFRKHVHIPGYVFHGIVATNADRYELYKSEKGCWPGDIVRVGTVDTDPMYICVSGNGETEADWKPHGKGEKGDKGDKGDLGDPGTDGDDGLNGWSPIFALTKDGDRYVLKVQDWTGGTGTKPLTGRYIGLTGWVVDVADAIDLRGPAGADGTNGSGSVGSSILVSLQMWLILLEDSPGSGVWINMTDAHAQRPVSCNITYDHPWNAGKVSTASPLYMYENGNTWYNVTLTSPFTVAASGFSFGAWFKPKTTLNGNGDPIQWGAGALASAIVSAGGERLFKVMYGTPDDPDTDIYFCVSCDGTTWTHVLSAPTHGPDMWTYVCATFDPVEGKLTIVTSANGFAQTTLTGGDTPHDISGATLSVLKVGGSPESGGLFKGHMDAPAYWKRALSLSEINVLINNGTGVSYAGLSEVIDPPFPKSGLHAIYMLDELEPWANNTRNYAASGSVSTAYFTYDYYDGNPANRPSRCRGPRLDMFAVSFSSRKKNMLRNYNQNGRVNIGTLAAGGGFTFACWALVQDIFYASADQHYDTIFSCYHFGNADSQFLIQRDSTQNIWLLYFVYSDGTQTWQEFRDWPVPYGSWVHYVVDYDLATHTVRFFANNELIGTMALTAGKVINASPTTYEQLGYSSTNNSSIVASDARIAQPAFWNRRLDNAERGALYNNGKGIIYTP